MNFSINELAWEKMQGLLPAIVQDAKTNAVLMLGYMNRQALEKTLESQWLTFYSRSKQRLWMKGESSGNRLRLVEITADCDQDSLLIRANTTGPVCHTGASACFVQQFPFADAELEFLSKPLKTGMSLESYTDVSMRVCLKSSSDVAKEREPLTDWEFILQLESIISSRQKNPSESSYTSELFATGLSRIAQKVGEEGVEVVIAAIGKNDQELCSEAADLWFHLMVLLQARNLSLSDVIEVLRSRERKSKKEPNV